MNKNKSQIVALALVILIFSGCTSSSEPEIRIENAWGRPSPKVATAGAFYMLIKNLGAEDDKLIGGESSACGAVELHESYKTEDGAMGMRPVEGGSINIPAKDEVELTIGGLHIMCIDKLEEFNNGTLLQLNLNFEKSGEISIELEIREP